MHSTKSIVAVGWRELWGTFLLVATLGLVFLGLGLLITWFDVGWRPEHGQTLADLPMGVAATWGGVVLAGAGPETQAFWLARPVGRLQWFVCQLAFLWIGILALGIPLNILGSWLGLGGIMPDASVLPAILYGTVCGLLAGSLLHERSAALGLAFVLATLLAPGAFLIAFWTLEAPVSTSSPLFRQQGGQPWALLLAAVVLAIPVVNYWRRWVPLRTRRSENTLLGMTGLALLALVVGARILVAVVL